MENKDGKEKIVEIIINIRGYINNRNSFFSYPERRKREDFDFENIKKFLSINEAIKYLEENKDGKEET